MKEIIELLVNRKRFYSVINGIEDLYIARSHSIYAVNEMLVAHGVSPLGSSPNN